MQKNSLFFHVNFKLSSGLYIIIKLLIELTVHVKFRDSGILVAGINWIITPSLIVNRCHNSVTLNSEMDFYLRNGRNGDFFTKWSYKIQFLFIIWRNILSKCPS